MSRPEGCEMQYDARAAKQELARQPRRAAPVEESPGSFGHDAR